MTAAIAEIRSEDFIRQETVNGEKVVEKANVQGQGRCATLYRAASPAPPG